MDVAAALREAAARLATASDTPRLDAELLMAHALGRERELLLLSSMESASPPAFEALVGRRARGEPIAYITGRRAFWTIELEVGPGVLIPRPDSETLMEAAVERFGAQGPRTVLDLGTGPGTLLLAALDQWPRAQGVGVDASKEALVYAACNAAWLGLEKRASFRLGSWGEGLGGRFDLILCNPPYVEDGAELPAEVAGFEPALALFAGPDGMAAYQELAPQIAALLAPGGIACIEVGAGQAGAVGALFAAQGLQPQFRHDLAGHRRCVLLRHCFM